MDGRGPSIWGSKSMGLKLDVRITWVAIGIVLGCGIKFSLLIVKCESKQDLFVKISSLHSHVNKF